MQSEPFSNSMAPWLAVRGSAAAVAFYKAAFNAVEIYRLDGGEDGIVAQLSIGGSTFWLSEESPSMDNPAPATLGGATTRFILTTADPSAVFAQALAAGAREVYPLMEEHGWLVGRVVDPFGHHWEIGRQLE